MSVARLLIACLRNPIVSALLGILFALLLLSPLSCTNEVTRFEVTSPSRSTVSVCSRSAPWDDSTSCTPEWSTGQIAPYDAWSKFGVIRAHVSIPLDSTVFIVERGTLQIAPDVDAALYEWQRWRLWKYPLGRECDFVECDSTGCDTTHVSNYHDARLYPYLRLASVVDGLAVIPGNANGWPSACSTRFLLRLVGPVEYQYRNMTVRARLVGVATFTAATQRETIDVEVTNYALSHQLP